MPKASVRLSLEPLDARIVPDATPVAVPNTDPLATPIVVTQPVTPDAGTQPGGVSSAVASSAPRTREDILADIACIEAAIDHLQSRIDAKAAETAAFLNGPLTQASQQLRALQLAYETARDEDKPALEYDIAQAEANLIRLYNIYTGMRDEWKGLIDQQNELRARLKQLYAELGALPPGSGQDEQDDTSPSVQTPIPDFSLPAGVLPITSISVGMP